MTFRRGATIVAVVTVAVVIAALIVYGGSLSRPVADGYTGHAASPSSTTPSATLSMDGTDESASNQPPEPTQAAPASGSAPAVPTDSGTAVPASPSDHPTWDPAAEAPEGADAEPKVPGGLGAEPYRLPSVPEREPALTAVPDAAVADGELAVGFPEAAVPVPDDAQIQTSSVSPQGQRVLVGLHALSDDDPETLRGFYTRHCEERGWPVTFALGPAGDTQLQCGFANDSMSVTASVLPTGRTGLTATGAFLVSGGN